MTSKTRKLIGAAAVAATVLLWPRIAHGAEEGKEDAPKKPKAEVTCEMKFSLKGWSAFYKTSKGKGTVSCSNGQSAGVSIKATGGGITFGKSEIVDGTGHFTGVNDISEVFGSYVQSEAHAGAGKSADAQALTKGEVSLALAGTGRGVDVGFAFGKFTISRGK